MYFICFSTLKTVLIVPILVNIFQVSGLILTSCMIVYKRERRDQTTVPTEEMLKIQATIVDQVIIDHSRVSISWDK